MFNIGVEILDNDIRKEKEIKGVGTGKEEEQMVIVYKDNHIDDIILKNRAPFTIGTKLYKGFIN